VKVFVPNNYDMAGVNITMDDHVLNTSQTISGNLKSEGAITVTSMDLNYNVNNGTVVTQSLTSLNLTSLSNYSFSHATPWIPTATGINTIKVWASNINGNLDQNTNNDTVTKSVYVANDLSQRKVIFEQFTSNTCGPCASSAPAITTFLNNNNVNSENGKIVGIKYHMNYPSPGNDAAYTTESTARHTYYGVTGIPHANLGGNAYSGHSGAIATMQTVVNSEYNRPAIFNIEISAEYTPDSMITITGNYTSHVDLSGNMKLHVVLIENLVQKSTMNGTGTTSQTTFGQVMRKMLPNATGTTVATQTEGQNTAFTQTYNLKTGVQIFSNINDLTAVAFIQNNTTKEVYQSNSAPVELNDVGIHESKSNVSGVNVYPNPVSNNANLVFSLKAAESTQITVYNMIGELVYSNQLGVLPQGNHSYSINTQEFISGLYFVNLKSGNTVTTKKISVIR
ncbi:MAG: Omp28-related outer membrane protein, partial [Bacteroidota bacterium]|nr:Omp28-related outer membrane protein [Bacteroidota bacterium]